MNKSTKLYLTMILVIAIILQIAAAAQKSFWEDEAYTASIAQGGLEAVNDVIGWDVHPPLLLYWVAHWGKLFGYTEIGLRSLPILFVIISMLLAFKLALDLFDEKTALLTVALLGFSPLLLMFGHNIRYYSMAMALTLLITLAMVRYQLSSWPIYLLIYALSCTIFLYLLFAAAVVILVCNLWWLALWMRNRSRSIANLVAWLLAQFVVLLLYLPGLAILASVMDRFSETATVANWLVEMVKRAAYFGFVFSLGETISPLSPLAWLGAAAVLASAIFAVVANRRKTNFWLPVFFVLFMSAAGILTTINASVSLTWQSISYRTLYVLPFLAMWLGAGIAAMKPRIGLIIGGVILLVFAAGNLNYFTGRQFLRPIYAVSWRAIFDQIQADAPAGVLVICGQGDFACGYYAQRYGYGRNGPGTWEVDANYQEVWWIQPNLGRGGSEMGASTREQIAEQYGASKVYNYAQQDPTIRWLKVTLMGQDDYAYRVSVYRFHNP